MDANECAVSVRLILSDVDGVMTAGGITYDSDGRESKTFHVRDGMAIKLWQRVGHQFGVITARRSPMVERRMEELGVEIVYQGEGDKLTCAGQIVERLGLTLADVCYIGDDLTDLSLLKQVGFAVTVADGVPVVQAAAHCGLTRSGGDGAMRELIEMILKQQNRWDEAIANYTN